MAKQTHVIVVPHAAQGHVTPLMKLSLRLAAHGVKVTFVNTEFIHEMVVASMPEKFEQGRGRGLLSLVSIPDGLGPEDKREDFSKARESILRVMPGHLKELIENISRFNVDGKVSCVIADTAAGWALEVAEKLGIKRVAVLVSDPANLALALHVPRLIEDGVIDADGSLIKDEPAHISEDILGWSSSELPWMNTDPALQKLLFQYVYSAVHVFELANHILFNTFYELNPSIMNKIPKSIPIGPFLSTTHFEAISGSFRPEDPTCLTWLDKQTTGSVIYVALGSTTMLSAQQVDELALGLELIALPFLLVVRSNLTDGSTAQFPDSFMDRVSDRGKFVEWAPQEKVLAHPSVACFVSHCGWNSTMEGLTMGVPFLCWPYFADQFHNKSYICDVWKIGLALDKDESGIITRDEICAKIKMLLSSDEIKANAMELRDVARKSVSEGGSSFRNFQSFIEQIQM